ncbi:polysaccharide deacetylase family protein [Lysobacter sp. H21R4]|uniref:polysaccharide deacetylase family protein n=1 Tax=Lysobacter sp. H21R4 TaxID=2781021 RepID=UPI0018890634|nr:polysaccharide deacetylase family protein [Lysobacter sp. H21R4]QOY61980.1 polysaccharide deacetylase family protein [Lysobacter sp. H21R4]
MTRRAITRWLTYLVAVASHYSGVDRLYRAFAGGGLVVLMLHRVRDEPDPYPLSITPASLRQLVGWIRREGSLTSLDDGLRSLHEPRGAGTAYALTFDDGYRDNLRLTEADLAGVPALVYLATGHVGGDPIWAYRLIHAIVARRHDQLNAAELGVGQFDLADPLDRQRAYELLPARLKQLSPTELEDWMERIGQQLQPARPAPERREMLDWNDVRKLASRGIGIGGHTRGHVMLSQVDEKTAREEIRGSCEHIRRELGSAPRHFAYPNGTSEDFGDRDARLVREAGFASAATTIEGVNRFGTDPYRLRRYNVYEHRYRSPSGRLSKALFMSDTSGLLSWFKTRMRA